MASDPLCSYGRKLHADDVLYHGSRMDDLLLHQNASWDFTGLDSDAVAGEFTNMLGNPALMTGL